VITVIVEKEARKPTEKCGVKATDINNLFTNNRDCAFTTACLLPAYTYSDFFALTKLLKRNSV